jgi:hypothetical protein
MQEYMPCPSCSSPRAKKVGFTWWGGVLGPNMLTHVKCQDCGTAYNGKTGRSNAGAIAMYCIVSGLIAVMLLVLLALFNHR